MSKTYNLTTPLSEADVVQLKAGDIVYLSGIIYTARDAAHKKLIDLMDAGEELPFDVEGSVIYFVGPTPPKPGDPIGSAGPTTSYRMDSYSPRL
ncbi:MAG TPA: TRZ/ATZ family protein, partial [Sulfurospirillum arcachonense]|nr:TRZ/ATZ family protein [Sulfurospirillum arcachonense]